MSKEKQIEGMTKFILELDTYTCEECDKCGKWQYEDQCDDTCFSKKVAESLYNAGYRKQEWISVDERLPERQGYYLGRTYKGLMMIAPFFPVYADDKPEFKYDISHWMPLPEAPKMKGGAE
jgi:hypothetical protein